MQSNLVIVANFAPDTTPHFDRLTLAIDGNGNVDGAANGQLLQIGQSYTLVATPASGSVFANWSGGVSGNSPSLNFVMQSNLVIVANFVEQGGGGPFQPDQLTLVIHGNGTVAGAANGQVLQIGSSYTITATPGAGSAFANWSGGVSGNSSTLNFVMRSNLVIVANFVEQGGTNFQPDQLTLVINGDGTVTGATNGQVLQIGSNYTLIATPGAGSIFANWSGGVSESSSTLNFMMQSNLVIVANFVVRGTGPFVPVAGVFSGLFFETNQVQADHSGFFTLRMTSAGKYFATLRTAGKKYLPHGRFSDDGRATNRIARAGASALTVIWEAHLQDSDLLSGSVSDGQWVAPLLGDRDIFNAGNPAPQAGRYTLIIPGTPGATDSPAGDGYATAVIDASGVVRLKGKLADGTPLVQNVAISKNGTVPLYGSLYNGRGVLLGWVQFADDGANDVSGTLRWIKPSLPSSKLYPAGFGVSSIAIGSRYTAPTGIDSVLQITDGVIILGGGDLPDSINPVTFGPNSKLVNNGPNALKLTFVPASGRFNGTFQETGTTMVFAIRGVVLQRQNIGSGYAPGTDQSGRVVFQAAP
jgi:hypothetical protein